MKKLLILLSAFVVLGNVAGAKEKKKKKGETTEQTLQLNSSTTLPGPDGSAPVAPVSNLKPDDISFTDLTYDFGTVQEGPDATCKFTFSNKGSEALVIQKAQASCGCTVPTYSKDPIQPGKEGSIDVAFHTLGKPAGAFAKTITVTSNAGVKVLTIKGNVEKAPVSSVPENTSMVKTN